MRGRGCCPFLFVLGLEQIGRQLGDIRRNPPRLLAQSSQPLAETRVTSQTPNCRVGLHGQLFIIRVSSIRPRL